MADFNLINYIKSTSLIQGSPESTFGKVLQDGSVESYGDFSKRSRVEINYHNTNGTDINAIRLAAVSGTVGSTINIQSRTGNPSIDNSFEDLIQEHSQVGNFEVTGRWHSSEFWRQTIGFELIQGGVLIRNHYNSKWSIPYRQELVGVDMVDISKSIVTENVQNGLKKDNYGRVTDIYLFDDYDKRKSSLHSAKNMTYFSSTWISLSQYTAVSRLAAILPTLDAVLQYSNSEVKAALERAKNGVYWHTELYGTILEALNEEFKNADSADERITEARLLLEGLSRKGVGVSGATATPVEDKITQIDNKTDTVYETITNQSQKLMAAASGGSQVGVYKDIEKGSYSSIKAAISFDEEHYKIEFDKLKNIVINDYLERLFQIGVQTNRVKLARSKYFSNPRKYMKWDVLRTSRRVLDEQKDATATSKNLETGVTNLNIEYSRRGMDYFEEEMKKTDIEIQVEAARRQKYKAANLPYPGDTEEILEGNTNDNN